MRYSGIPRIALLAGLLALQIAATGEAADGSPVRRLPLPAGWEPLELPGVERGSDYLGGSDGQVHARSACGASALVTSLDEIDLRETPILRWRWRVTHEPETTDERSKAGDDFAARVYVMFVFEPERAGWLARARQALGETLYGTVPGSAINYVWSRAIPAGEAWKNPFVAASRMVSLGRGELGEWRSVEVDVLADYERLFGHPAPGAIGIALMSDSDNSCSQSEAWLSGFELAPRTP